MWNYNLLKKFEKVVIEFQQNQELFDYKVIAGVRSLASNSESKKTNTPYMNCNYFGEIAERCEERGLANNIKSLRSILIAFVIETQKPSKNDFLYNQFEIFEEIYRRVSGENFSLLDEILLKKCKSQVTKNNEDFILDYNVFSKEHFTKASVEEQTFTILALSSYRINIDENQLDDYYSTFEYILKLFTDNDIRAFNIVHYSSLSHIYDFILDHTKTGRLKSFSKKDKDFYKCIRDVVTTDLSTIFPSDDLELYKRDTVVFSNQVVDLDKIIKINYDSISYSSAMDLVKKEPTLPAKCRKLAKYFNYNISNGIIDIDAISKMKSLYKDQDREFYSKYLFEYLNLEFINDPYLYAEFFEKTCGVVFNSYNLSSVLEEAGKYKKLWDTMLKCLTDEFISLYKSGDIDKIAHICKKYMLFDYVLSVFALKEPIGFYIEMEVKKLNKSYNSFNSSKAMMLLKNNCIDLNLNIFIDNKVLKVKEDNISIVVASAWSLDMFKFCIDLAKVNKLAFDSFRDIFGINSNIYYRDCISTDSIISHALNTAYNTEHYDLVMDFILTLLIRHNRFDILKTFIKEHFDKITSLYCFTEEDKINLIKHFILETVDLDKMFLNPDSFLFNKVGINKGFELLEIDEDTAFTIKMNYINYYENLNYCSDFTKNCIKEIKDTLSENDLEKIAIQKHKAYIEDIKSTKYLYCTNYIKYFEKNKEYVFKYCIEALNDLILYLIEKHDARNLSTLYIYLKSKNIQILESNLEQLNKTILADCLR